MLVKGADWAADAIVGRDIVEARGGRVVRIPLAAGYSTSAIVEKIARAECRRSRVHGTIERATPGLDIAGPGIRACTLMSTYHIPRTSSRCC